MLAMHTRTRSAYDSVTPQLIRIEEQFFANDPKVLILQGKVKIESSSSTDSSS